MYVFIFNVFVSLTLINFELSESAIFANALWFMMSMTRYSLTVVNVEFDNV